jgi:cold-inducible RNA-binding protein
MEKAALHVGRLLYSGVYFAELATQGEVSMKTTYVGNLDFQTTKEELRKLFGPYGTVERVLIPHDPATLKSRGLAFVDMRDENAAAEAIRALNGSQLGGRSIVVNEARPKADSARADTGRGSGERRFGHG